jgi:hypothetical protein
MSIDYAHTHDSRSCWKGPSATPPPSAPRCAASPPPATRPTLSCSPSGLNAAGWTAWLRYTFTTDGQPGRFTPPTAHDTADQRLPATIAAVEAVRELNRISVITRDGDEIFTNFRGPDGRWHHPGRAHQALTAHLSRPMPADQAREWLAQYRILLDSLHQRRSVDRRELSTYVGLHSDAQSILTMASTTRRIRNAGTSSHATTPTRSSSTTCRRWPHPLPSSLPNRFRGEASHRWPRPRHRLAHRKTRRHRHLR